MKKAITLLLIAAAASINVNSTWAAMDPAPFPFDVSQITGDWAESYNTDPACSPENLHFKIEFTPDRLRLTVLLDRMWKFPDGTEADRYTAQILSATAQTLIIRYDNEKRITPIGKPVEWELAIVAPGVYRWRETDWRPGAVNTVVGVKCS